MLPDSYQSKIHRNVEEWVKIEGQFRGDKKNNEVRDIAGSLTSIQRERDKGKEREEERERRLESQIGLGESASGGPSR